MSKPHVTNPNSEVPPVDLTKKPATNPNASIPTPPAPKPAQKPVVNTASKVANTPKPFPKLKTGEVPNSDYHGGNGDPDPSKS